MGLFSRASQNFSGIHFLVSSRSSQTPFRWDENSSFQFKVNFQHEILRYWNMTLPFFNIVRVLCVWASRFSNANISSGQSKTSRVWVWFGLKFNAAVAYDGDDVTDGPHYIHSSNFVFWILICVLVVEDSIFGNVARLFQSALGELGNFLSMGNIQAIQNSLRCSRKEFGWRMLSFRVVSCEGDW